GGLLDQLSGRRGLGDEGERAILVHRDLDRDDVPALVGGRIVVGLDELHHVHAGSAERGTHGRRRCGLAGLDLALDDARDLLLGSHCSSSLWCGPGGAHHALLPLRGPYSLMAGTGPRYDGSCTSRRPRPGSRGRLAGLDLELDDARDLLRGSHCSSSLWCGPGGAHHALLPLRGPYSLMAGTGPSYDVTCTSRRRRPESGVILVVLARHGGRAAAQI